MDYKKKSLNKMNRIESYEEIDSRLASGWYVDSIGNTKSKKYKTKKVSFKISKKVESFWILNLFKNKYLYRFFINNFVISIVAIKKLAQFF